MYIYILFNIFVAFSLKQNKIRFCHNCKHFIKDNMGFEFGKCGAFPIINNDIENKDEKYYYCGTARTNREMCGEDGSLYRMKYDKNLVKDDIAGNKKK